MIRTINGEASQKVFSKEVQQEYLKRAYNGDGEAKKKLVEHNLRLVFHVLRGFNVREEIQEELYSLGHIGLIKAVNTYNIYGETTFATYAWRCIRNEMLMFLRKYKKVEISLDSLIDEDFDGYGFSIMDTLFDPFDSVSEMIDREESRQEVLEALTNLKMKELKVIWSLYGFKDDYPKTQRQIAAELGITQSQVSRLKKQAITKLRSYLLKQYDDGPINVFYKRKR